MNAQEKEQTISELGERFARANAAYVVGFEGCSCADLTGLRRELRGSGARFAVVKNTLARRAVATTTAAGLSEHFRGAVGVVWSDEDPVTPAKVLTNFAKAQEKLVIKAGVVDGAVVDASGVENIASMPSKEELLSKLLALINAPATRLLQTIQAPGSQLVRLLEAWRVEVKKRGE